jgi:hypothetical protein
MLVGSMVLGTTNHPDDYRKSNIEIKGIIIKMSGSQCRVHVFELDGKPTDRIMFMHTTGIQRVLSR